MGQKYKPVNPDFDLDVAKLERKSFALPVTLGVAIVVAVCSLTFAAGLAMFWINDTTETKQHVAEVEAERDSSQQSLQQLRVKLAESVSALQERLDAQTTELADTSASLEDERHRAENLSAQVGSLRVSLDAAKAEIRNKQRLLEAAKRSPKNLEQASEAALLGRLPNFRVDAAINLVAKTAGLGEGMLIAQVKSVGAHQGLQFTDAAAAPMIGITVDVLSKEQNSGVAVVISLSISELWRIPGTDKSHEVQTYNNSIIKRISARNTVGEILQSVEDMTLQLTEMIRSAKTPQTENPDNK